MAKTGFWIPQMRTGGFTDVPQLQTLSRPRWMLKCCVLLEKVTSQYESIHGSVFVVVTCRLSSQLEQRSKDEYSSRVSAQQINQGLIRLKLQMCDEKVLC